MSRGPAKHARILAVTSGKGGAGKTFFAANLAAAFAARDEKVLVIDAALGLANLDVMFDLNPKVTLQDVFAGRCKLAEAILPAPGNFSVLLAGSGLVEYARVTQDLRGQLLGVLETMRARFDRVLLDTGAGISEVVLYSVSLADDVLMLATPEPTSLIDAYAAIKVYAAQQERSVIRLAVNQTRLAGEGRAIRRQVQAVVDRYINTGTRTPLHLDYVGEVRTDVSVRQATQNRQLVVDAFPGATVARALIAIAAKLAAPHFPAGARAFAQQT